jgi:molybdopterin-guanine dinucleotide biosynthesis protein A
MPRRCVGAILAGGSALRMHGVAKGLERVGGSRLIDLVATALAAAADEVIVVANAADAAGWLPGTPVVRDRRAGLGALGGIHAALDATAADVLTVPWDTPFVPAGLLRTLREVGEAGDADIVAPRSASPWGHEPLCAWFSRAALGPVGAALDAGDGRAGALAARANLSVVDVSSWGDGAELFFNVNTRADLDRAESIAARLRGGAA